MESTVAAYRDMATFTSSSWASASGIYYLIKRAAIGVMLCLGPYNYPFNETYATLIPALLMGEHTSYECIAICLVIIDIYNVILWISRQCGCPQAPHYRRLGPRAHYGGVCQAPAARCLKLRFGLRARHSRPDDADRQGGYSGLHRRGKLTYYNIIIHSISTYFPLISVPGC